MVIAINIKAVNMKERQRKKFLKFKITQRDIYNSINLCEGDQVIINGTIAKIVTRYPTFVLFSKYGDKKLFSIANTDITNENTTMIQISEDSDYTKKIEEDL